VDEYLGVKIEKREDDTEKMYQPYLITQILENLDFNNKTKKHTSSGQQNITQRHIMERDDN